MDKQRLLVIGARGFVGTHTVHAAAGTFEVIRGDRSAANEPSSVQMDISDAKSVNRAFERVRPDLVILLAAISDIDRCEAFPADAFAINARGPENVATACARTKTRMLFTSTGAVFDGGKHGYTEEDEPSPLSVYGKTKVSAENAVTSLTPSAVILRFGLVVGFAGKRGTNAMLDKVIQQWKAGEALNFFTYEKRNPIDADFLSKLLIHLVADSSISGVYHAGASDCISRYELGKRLAIRCGISLDLVRPQDAVVPGRAPRGADHFLLTDKLRRDCHVEAGTSDQVIERCFSWNGRGQSCGPSGMPSRMCCREGGESFDAD